MRVESLTSRPESTIAAVIAFGAVATHPRGPNCIDPLRFVRGEC